jgi:hypothetical protein
VFGDPDEASGYEDADDSDREDEQGQDKNESLHGLLDTDQTISPSVASASGTLMVRNIECG